MSTPFRAVAVDQYRVRRLDNAAPSLALPRTRAVTVVLGLLLLAVLTMTWFTRLPVYVSGVGVIVDATDGVQIAALLPAAGLPRLASGQPLYVAIGSDNRRLQRAITSLESTPLSPDHIPDRLALGELTRGVVVMLDGPTVIAFAPFDPPSDEFDAATYVGSIVRTDVEVGSRSILSLVVGGS